MAIPRTKSPTTNPQLVRSSTSSKICMGAPATNTTARRTMNSRGRNPGAGSARAVACWFRRHRRNELPSFAYHNPLSMSAGAPTSAREARALPFILARPQRWRVATAGVVLVLVLVLAPPTRASDHIPAPPQAKPIALKGATIHPVSGPDIPSGTIVFDKGRITALGPDVPVPDGAEVVDVSGKHIYPGLISANSVLGLIEIGAARATVDVAEAGAINPNVRAISSINPDSELLPVARANGILTAHIVPEGGLISGQSSVIRMDGWTPEEMAVRSPSAMHLRWPTMTIDR